MSALPIAPENGKMRLYGGVFRVRRFDRRKTDRKCGGKTRAALLFMCAVLWLTACLSAGFAAVAAAEDVDAAGTAPTTAAEAGATAETEVTVDPEATVDPDATPVPTYNGNIIAFEVPEGSGKKNTSSAGGIIMIIIIALAFISVASGIVEKIVRYYKERDERFSKE